MSQKHAGREGTSEEERKEEEEKGSRTRGGVSIKISWEIRYHLFLIPSYLPLYFFSYSEEEESEEEGEDPALDSLSQAIAFQVNK